MVWNTRVCKTMYKSCFDLLHSLRFLFCETNKLANCGGNLKNLSNSSVSMSLHKTCKVTSLLTLCKITFMFLLTVLFALNVTRKWILWVNQWKFLPNPTSNQVRKELWEKCCSFGHVRVCSPKNISLPYFHYTFFFKYTKKCVSHKRNKMHLIHSIHAISLVLLFSLRYVISNTSFNSSGFQKCCLFY